MAAFADSTAPQTGPHGMDLDQLSLKFERHTDAENIDFVLRVNAIDINQLFGFGVEGNGTVEFWGPRSRARVGILRLLKDRLLPMGSVVPTLPGIDDGSSQSLSVTAISSRADGLPYANGSSGHAVLYDIRSSRPLAIKDQGYGLPVKNVNWIEGGSRMAGDGLILSPDKKVIKIWDWNSLGLAPRWASSLEDRTEEMEDQTMRTAYQDYKFAPRDELTTLPYMHGYFLSLSLYDAARVIANPYVYAEHRERAVHEKMDELAESRIRTPKNALATVKVDKSLAEKIRKEEERTRKKEERTRKKEERTRKKEERTRKKEERTKKKEERKRAKKAVKADGDAMDVEEDSEAEVDDTTGPLDEGRGRRQEGRAAEGCRDVRRWCGTWRTGSRTGVERERSPREGAPAGRYVEWEQEHIQEIMRPVLWQQEYYV
ncbi:hypothetical protein C8Q72DRAFT_793751 [Fomitopsis betulina]|nr:hypothetical protein C8Q72DRAFT_793751 [Fomitopsis betulina]